MRRNWHLWLWIVVETVAAAAAAAAEFVECMRYDGRERVLMTCVRLFFIRLFSAEPSSPLVNPVRVKHLVRPRVKKLVIFMAFL